MPSMPRSSRVSLLLVTWLFLSLNCIAPLAQQPGQQAQYRDSEAAATKFEKGPPASWVNRIAIPAAISSTEPNTVRLADTQFNFANGDEAVYIHRVVRANNATGIPPVGQIALGFNPAYQTMRLHSLRVLRNNEVIDKLGVVKIRFLERELELEQSVYSGTATVAILLEDVREGDSVEYDYTLTGFNPVFKGVMYDAISWDVPSPVQLRHVSMLTPADRPINYRIMGDNQTPNAIKITQASRAGMHETIFEQSNVAPLRFEGFYPKDYQPFVWIQLSEYQSWNQVARWADDIFQTPPPKSAEYQAIIDRLRARKNPAAQVVEALDFVQSEIRYTSIAFGENSHRPATPDEVLSRRYGDCKDKTLLLVTILRALGLDAKPALLSVEIQRQLNRWLPAPAPFDHVIVRLNLNGTSYWIDPTALQKPHNLDTLGRFYGGFDTLVVDPDTHELAQIAPAQPDVFTVQESVSLKNMDGPATLERKISATGAIAEKMRFGFAQNAMEVLKKGVLSDVQQIYTSPEWIGDIAVKDDPARNELTYTAKFSIKEYVKPYDNGWLLRHKPTYISSFFGIPEVSHRTAPYALSFPVNTRYLHTVELPAGISVVANDAEESIANNYFSLQQIQKRKGDIASTEYVFKTLSGQVPAKEMDNYIADIRKVQSNIHPLIYVGKNNVATADPKNSTQESRLGTALRSRLKNTEKFYTSAIDGGKYSGDDLASAYAERAYARALLGDLPSAMQDIDHAVQISEQNIDALKTRAEIYYIANDLQKSLTIYKKALLSSDTPADIHYRRATSNVILKKYDLAIDELQQTLASNPGQHDKIYAVIWYAIAAKRGGLSLPADVRDLIATLSNASWPGPLLRLFNEETTVEAVVTEINQTKGDERLLNLCEAYFYIGELSLAKGDEKKAREYFEKSRKTEAITYFEYLSAGVELARLGLR